MPVLRQASSIKIDLAALAIKFQMLPSSPARSHRQAEITPTSGSLGALGRKSGLEHVANPRSLGRDFA
jgi:hypothetical protein